MIKKKAMTLLFVVVWLIFCMTACGKNTETDKGTLVFTEQGDGVVSGCKI